MGSASAFVTQTNRDNESMASIFRALSRLAVMVALAVPVSLRANESPNVLFIVADDLNCAIAPYGDPVAITPNLQRLAARGLVFHRAYCQQAVCNPSRSSFLTGLRPDKVGVDDLRKYFRDTAPNGRHLVTLPQQFKNHGYFCQNIGKIFHNMGDTQDRASWSIDEAFFQGTHAADTVFSNQPVLPGIDRPKFKAPVTEALPVPDVAYRDGQIASLAAGVLRQLGSCCEPAAEGDTPTRQPFFLAIGFWRPHLPFVAPRRYWDEYDPQQIPLPDPASPPQDVPAIAMHDSREIRGYGHVPIDRPWTEAEIRHYRHGYYASIRFLDAQLGRILDALEQSGLAEQTIIVFTSDHGFHIGEQTLWGKTSNFELDARVPLIIASPRHPGSHGKSTEALVELVDLYPTLAELANLTEDLPQNLDGVSLCPILRDPLASVKDAAWTQHQHPFYGGEKNWRYQGRSMRTARWRYTQWESIADGQVVARELYDHQNDPKETRNVAEVEAYQSTVAELANRMEAIKPESP